MTACLFLGPSLPAAEAAAATGATILPPVRLGDVHRAVTRFRPRAIAIADGYFQWAPAVWHKEILWAMSQGVHVLGAASMGALRAAELAAFGMRPVGHIAEAYCAGSLGGEPFEDDDEVAVAHGPAETGYLATSEAMVDIRLTLARAAAEGVIDAAACAALTARAKDTFFPDRAWAPLLAAAPALAPWLPAGRVRQKRADALALCAALSDLLAADPGPFVPGFALERTTYWDRAEAAFAAGPERLVPGLRLDIPGSERFSGAELRAWYFEKVVGAPVPDDLGGWMRAQGFADAGDLDRTAFAAYLFADAQ